MSKIEVNTVDAQCGSTITVGSSGKNVKIEGNDIRSNDYKASDGGNIINQCGTTITLGASGDTVSLASGASQTGFGRTGTVNWDTTAKTASFTAVSGNGYFINTSSSAITMTLPASPSAGDIVSVKDYAYTFATNNLTVDRNGSPIGGGSDFNTIAYDTDGAFLTFIYADGTKGWLLTDESNNTSDAVETYITATGGCITTCGNYKIHTFTGPGTFSVTAGAGPIAVADYLVIAGGGGTRNSVGGSRTAGGGGAGGYRESNPAPGTDWTGSPIANPGGALPFTPGCYPVTVGAGGAPSPSAAPGSNSVFSTITSNGGGGSSTGGSGAGATHGGTVGPAGNTPPTTPAQGNPGGRGYDSGNGSANFGAGGGGGAGGAGAAASTSPSGNAGPGGNGTTSCISASPVTRAGGGGGGAQYGPATPSYTAGSGGPGGGGSGSRAPTGPSYSGSAGSGTANTGGGGGGNGGSPSPDTGTGGAGGSGIVIVRYRFQ